MCTFLSEMKSLAYDSVHELNSNYFLNKTKLQIKREGVHVESLVLKRTVIEFIGYFPYTTLRNFTADF